MENNYYYDLGTEHSKEFHGMPDNLEKFFKDIYNGLILSPDDWKYLENTKKVKIEEEIKQLESDIDELDKRIKDMKKDVEKYRKEKNEARETWNKLELNKGKQYNPFTYFTFLVVNSILLLAIVLIYSIFFMHMFSHESSNAILPSFSELSNLFSKYWVACFATVIPVSLSFAIDKLFREKEMKFRPYIIAFLIILTLSLDFIIALSTRTRINQVNAMLNIPATPLLEDTNFWVVLFLGPLPVFLLSLLLYLTHKNSKSTINKFNGKDEINSYKERAEYLRKKEQDLENKINEKYIPELKRKKESLFDLKNKKGDYRYLPKELIDKNINQFYLGWTKWIINFYNSSYEQEQDKSKTELLEECKTVLEKFNQDIEPNFDRIS